VDDSSKMEEIPITGLEELERHLQKLLEDPDAPVDVKLFDEVELQLTGRFELFVCLSLCLVGQPVSKSVVDVCDVGCVGFVLWCFDFVFSRFLSNHVTRSFEFDIRRIFDLYWLTVSLQVLYYIHELG
jgi:hypothetical protein